MDLTTDIPAQTQPACVVTNQPLFLVFMSDDISHLSRPMSSAAVWELFSYSAELIFPGKIGDSYSWKDKEYICVCPYDTHSSG